MGRITAARVTFHVMPSSLDLTRERNNAFCLYFPLMMHVQETDTTHCRSIWISDVHLGTRTCWAGRLLDFLRHHESQYLYLVGDVVDGWQLKKSWYWTQQYNDVIQKVLRKVRKGTRVIYIPGNHDGLPRF